MKTSKKQVPPAAAPSVTLSGCNFEMKGANIDEHASAAIIALARAAQANAEAIDKCADMLKGASPNEQTCVRIGSGA